MCICPFCLLHGFARYVTFRSHEEKDSAHAKFCLASWIWKNNVDRGYYMMTSYQTRVRFQSGPQAVYEALTTPEGLRGWWTIDCDVSTEVGGEHTFRFEGVVFNSMEVVELVPYTKVHWACTEGWSEWLGTEVIFTLLENEEGGTDLV